MDDNKKSFDENWFVIQSLVDLRNTAKDLHEKIDSHQVREEEKFDKISKGINDLRERMVVIEEQAKQNRSRLTAVGSIVLAAITAFFTSIGVYISGRI
jgi:septal ring factor EnvC (AmiA/AmiB activator)